MLVLNSHHQSKSFDLVEVSILVLMDVGLKQKTLKFLIFKVIDVSILVLMDVGLKLNC